MLSLLEFDGFHPVLLRFPLLILVGLNILEGEDLQDKLLPFQSGGGILCLKDLLQGIRVQLCGKWKILHSFLGFIY